MRTNSNYARTLFAAVVWCGSVCGQQPAAPRTPWHVSQVFSHTHEGQPGTGIASGTGVASVPVGYKGVVEHVSARCVAPPALAIIYGEILVSANPSSPGQSGTPGPPPREDTAHHPLLFQKAYSGDSNVYVASLQATLRLNAPIGRVVFHIDVFNPGSASAVTTCLLSVSGYLEKQ
jgi:hypothetical protein